jgi:hypothetical protein
MDFSIVGQYLNRNQAFSNPAYYAQIRVIYKQLEGNKLQSENWYEYLYPTGEPYKKEYHSYDVLSPTEVEFQSYNMDWQPTCKFKFTWDGDFWIAEPCGKCIVKGVTIQSTVKFNQDLYISEDVGYDKTGNIVFGRVGMPFIFDRIQT